jgi:ABC-type glycerol-3-phosphate transport system substrate-binding protein
VHHFGCAELPDKLGIAMKTGINAPDIVQTDEMFFSVFLGPQIPFVDLTKKAKESGLTHALLPQRQAIFTYKNKLYGIPQSLSNVVLYYREDLFKQDGINPKDIDTWDKFYQVGKKIRKQQRSLLARFISSSNFGMVAKTFK